MNIMALGAEVLNNLVSAPSGKGQQPHQKPEHPSVERETKRWSVGVQKGYC